MIQWRIDSPVTDSVGQALLRIHVDGGDSVTRIALDGALDGQTTARFRAACASLAERERPQYVEVDCERLSFLGAAGAACLLQCMRMITSHDGVFRVVRLARFHRRVLDACGLLDLLTGTDGDDRGRPL